MQDFELNCDTDNWEDFRDCEEDEAILDAEAAAFEAAYAKEVEEDIFGDREGFDDDGMENLPDDYDFEG